MSKSTRQRWHTGTRDTTIYDEDGSVVVPLIETADACRCIVADHNACLNIKAPETTVPELVETVESLMQAFDETWPSACTQECFDTSGDCGYEIQEAAKEQARAVLDKAGQKHATSGDDDE